MIKSPLLKWMVRIAVFLVLNFGISSLYWSLTGGRPLQTTIGHYLTPRFVGEAAVAMPLPPDDVPQNPYLSMNGTNNMHQNSYASNTSPFMGPLGDSPSVISSAQTWLVGGQCVTITYDAKGRIITYCAGFNKTNLVLFDPQTLKPLDKFPVPSRPVGKTGDIDQIVTDTSGGAYFVMDHHHNAVIGLPDNTIKVVGVDESSGNPRLVLRREYGLGSAVGSGNNKIGSVMPDWQGHLWFVTRYGIIGLVDRESGVVQALQIEDGEEIQNSFAVDEQGAYVVSNAALYKLTTGQDGAPAILWREPYERGTQRKVGQIDQGSGTTPTLFGDGYVAITDNAEPRMHVLVYKRNLDQPGEQRLVCKVPVFLDHDSATENTLVGYDHSVIVENNAGYSNFTKMILGKHSNPGLARIDVREDESGCDVIWENYEVIGQTSVPVVSLPDGLLYVYAKSQFSPPLVDAFYFTAIDFRTGETVFRQLAGTGVMFDNNGSPFSIGPDGTSYIGTLGGVMAVQDAGTSLPFNPIQVFNQRFSALIRWMIFLLSLYLASQIK
jgi:hypothetical protein